jgi:hypothetical protein|uniref:Uncharacterized protein n=1 Tax=Ignisphaera aggregans TaxID=334771 RepID=A0A7J2U5E3_9CREN
MYMQIDIITALLIAVMLGLIVYAIKSALDYSKKKKETIEQENKPMKIVSIVTCQQNDYTIEREFKEGDFIGKIDGTCPKCNSQMVITKIYSVNIEMTQKSFKP